MKISLGKPLTVTKRDDAENVRNFRLVELHVIVLSQHWMED